MVRLDHVVLLFREKPVLGGKQAGKLAWKSGHDQIPAVTEAMVGGGLIAEQGQPFTGKVRRGVSYEVLNSESNHGSPFWDSGWK
jgi:hypothetical protein